MNFTKKVVIVVGGASGIGLGSAKSFSENGAMVVIVDIDEKALKLAKNQIEHCFTIVADVRLYGDVKKAVDETIKKFKTIDILVNCVGGNSTRLLGSHQEFCDRPIEHIEWGLDVNLKGPVYFCHAVMPFMREQKSGVIINIGSVTGIEGDAHGADYAIAKSGVMEGLTKSMAILGAKYGVRCCCISPGPVLTRPGMSSMKTLIGRAGEIDEIVDFIVYLSTEKAAFITGVNYVIDGGRTILPKY